MTIGGFGVQLKVGGTTVVDVIDLTWPELANVLVDVTAHDSTGGWREHVKTGLREHSTFVATIGWDDTQATHSTLITNFDTTAAQTYSMVNPDGSETISFSAHVVSMGRVSSKDGYYQMDVTFQITGVPTLS